MFVDNSLQSVKDIICSKLKIKSIPISEYSEEYIYIQDIVKELNELLLCNNFHLSIKLDEALRIELYHNNHDYIFTIVHIYKLQNGLFEVSLKNHIHGSHSRTKPITFEKAKKVINKQLKFHFKEYL